MKTYNWKITFKCYDDECVCGELTPKNITLKVDIILKKTVITGYTGFIQFQKVCL